MSGQQDHEAIRRRIVVAAEAEVGPQTKGHPKVYGYWRDVLPSSWSDAQVKQYAAKKEWCGGFALWAIRQAGIAPHVHWVDGLGFTGPARLAQTGKPQPGDVAYTHSPFQHHAIVHSLEGTILTTIDGNQPDCRKKVRVLPPGMLFFSIDSLLEGGPFAGEKRPTLRRGSLGEHVVFLQGELNERGSRLKPDGIFGPVTDLEVRQFQAANNLLADGIVGPKTWAKLEELEG